MPGKIAGALGRDGWSPYRKLLECAHQTCLGHLLVRCRDMLGVAGAEAQGILTSVFRTARQQGREPVGLMVKLLRSPRPLDLGLARGAGGRPRFTPLPRGQPAFVAA